MVNVNIIVVIIIEDERNFCLKEYLIRFCSICIVTCTFCSEHFLQHCNREPLSCVSDRHRAPSPSCSSAYAIALGCAITFIPLHC